MPALSIGSFGFARRHYANAISSEMLPNLVEGILARDKIAISRSITLRTASYSVEFVASIISGF